MKSLTSQELIIQSNLSSLPKKRQFGRRSHLPLESNYLWKIESGVVRTLTYLEDGTTVTLGLWGVGDIVGRGLSKTEPFEIECLTIVEATITPFDRLSMSGVLLECIQQAEELMLIRSHRTIDVIIVKMLIWLAKKFGRTIETGELIDLRLTHQDIAELVGTTRVTVTRILLQLEEQGLIQRLPLHLTVVQAQELWHYEI
jgi:CRP-like cAMP-binding protein